MKEQYLKVSKCLEFNLVGNASRLPLLSTRITNMATLTNARGMVVAEYGQTRFTKSVFMHISVLNSFK